MLQDYGWGKVVKEDERNGTHKAETYDPAYTGPNVFAIDTDDGLKSILRMSRQGRRWVTRRKRPDSFRSDAHPTTVLKLGRSTRLRHLKSSYTHRGVMLMRICIKRKCRKPALE